jgi:HlyD family secretion protein
LNEAIELIDISFTYPGKQSPALSALDLRIPVNKTVGLVGASGSGKSTVIDMLLGLIQPDSGRMLIDGESLDAMRLRAWQNNLGFVPQSIFLSDASVLENVAFGLAKETINVERARHAVSLAHLDDLVSSLPDGLNTRIGERGVQLSGGQRQRIGIARALYQDAGVLIFDEATSALDGITEKMIMDAIHDFSGTKTVVIVAHRLKTVEKCDIIYFVDHGKVVDSGKFDDLKSRNPTFRKMAQHA